MEPESDGVNSYKVAGNMMIGVVQDGRGYLKVTEAKQLILCLGAQRVQ